MKKRYLFLFMIIIICLCLAFPVYASELCNYPENEGVLKAMRILGFIIDIIKIIIPALLIIKAVLYLINAVMLGEESDASKIIKELLKNITIALLIFFVPEILEAFISLLGHRFESTMTDFNACWVCFTNDGECALNNK